MTIFATWSGFAFGFMLANDINFRRKFYSFQQGSWALVTVIFVFVVIVGVHSDPDSVARVRKFMEDIPSSPTNDELELDLDTKFVGGLVLGLLMCGISKYTPWTYPVFSIASVMSAVLYGSVKTWIR